ncbi:ferredoxin [Streptomyces sp. NPDC099050]|uniref:ferredoxin n=1 Tax=Streptomyces sp. NPDC099050 TaxID=3366100 RepID=UPI0037FEDAB1
MTPVACGECDAVVLCEKFSPAHTQVQWTEEAAAACPRIAAEVAAGLPSGRVRSCGPLRAGIEAAVLAGRLEVPADV